MKVSIKDIDILQTLQPQQVAIYLKNHGWYQQQQIDDKASIWTNSFNNGESVLIVLPLHSDIPGFPISMSVILETLEKIENRSQLDIIGDLTTAVNHPID